jgi:predicted component of type VI protein secretion system
MPGEKMKTRHLLLPLIVLCVLAGCSKNKWEGFVYPNKNDLTIHKNAGVFNSLEQCRAAALDMLLELGAKETGDYECGLNCENRAGLSMKVCEKTER